MSSTTITNSIDEESPSVIVNNKKNIVDTVSIKSDKLDSERSCTSSVISSYLKDILNEAQKCIENESKMKKMLPRPPSTAPSITSRSSSTISHYLKDVISNAVKDVALENKKPEKTLQFGNINNSTLSLKSTGSNDVSQYVGEMLKIVVKDVNDENEQNLKINNDKNNELDELDDIKFDEELDVYIDDLIKKIANELNQIYPKDDQSIVEFDHNDLVNARPKTTSSRKGKKNTKVEEDDFEDDESIKDLSIISQESELKQVVAKEIDHLIESQNRDISVTPIKRKDFVDDSIQKTPSIHADESLIEKFDIRPESRVTNNKSPESIESTNKSLPKLERMNSGASLRSNKSSGQKEYNKIPVERTTESRMERRNSRNENEEKSNHSINENSENNFKNNENKSIKEINQALEKRNVKNKKLQVDLLTKRERSRSKKHRKNYITDSYQLFDQSSIYEKDAAVQTSKKFNGDLDSSSIINRDDGARTKQSFQTSIGIQASSTEPCDNDEKRLLKRDKSRKRNLDYRRIFYYYHEELRKLQNNPPRADKAIEGHVNRIKSANRNIIREEMFEDKNLIVAPVFYSIDPNDFQDSSGFYSPENDIGGFGTDTAKLSKIAYDVRRDEVKLRNRLMYGCSKKNPNTQSFEPRYLSPKRQFLPFGTILKVPSLQLGHQKEKLTLDRERELISRLHDNHVYLPRKKELNY